jgi:hypothetical protein
VSVIVSTVGLVPNTVISTAVMSNLELGLQRTVYTFKYIFLCMWYTRTEMKKAVILPKCKVTVRVGFLVDRMALGDVFLLCVILPALHIHSFI